MSNNIITVRLVQTSPVLGDIDRNRREIESSLSNAAEDGVDLLVFPELFLTGYYIDQIEADAVDEAAAAVDYVESVAPDVTTIIGTPVREDESVYNSAVVLDAGERQGVYHKTHLYDTEDQVFEPGSTIPTFETSAGAIGVQICYDVEFPEVSRELTRNGAELLVTLSANMRPFATDQETYWKARALENVRPHVLCNRIGEERGTEFFGASGIVNERGRSVVTAGEDVSVELTASIELRKAGDSTLQYLADLRPEIYTNADTT